MLYNGFTLENTSSFLDPLTAASVSRRPRLHLHLRGKTVLLTGGTGFLGKVVVERLLRCAPEIARIYLLIRTQRDPEAPPISADARFETEVLPSGAFDALARDYGDRWPAFARDKIVPVAGDVSQPRLGLSDDAYAALTSSTDIIINSAASVTFDAPIDEALLHNTRSVAHVAEFARACRSTVLVHVSTAFVAGQRTGRIAEAPLSPDISSAEVGAIDEAVAAVRREAAGGRWNARTTRARLADEGMTRAKRLGWHDTYTFTKALGEMTLARNRGDVPTAIIRPTIIESSFRDPAPGWLENLNVVDPLFVEYGRGRMPDFPVGLDTVYDMVPVDFVANALLAVLPRVAESTAISYYTIGSGVLNPVTGAHLYEFAKDYFTRHPMYDRRGQPIPAKELTSPTFERFREMFADQARRSSSIKRLLYLADLYETYISATSVFDTTNTERLLGDLDEADRMSFDFDARRIDWRAYIQDVHIPGLRRHVLREDVRARAEVSESV
jgi:nucleoside-diphosphate-sugar epimerase